MRADMPSPSNTSHSGTPRPFTSSSAWAIDAFLRLLCRTATMSLNDSRVSRVHATVEWRGGHFVLSDTSSFGTWVYMGNQSEPVVLRRTECYLVGQGQIVLGCEREAESAPAVAFSVRA